MPFSKPKAFYMLESIQTLLNIKPEYDSEKTAYKVLSEIHPINDWVNKINEFFYFHLSSQMILNHLQSYDDAFVISESMFREVLKDTPRSPTVSLDSNTVMNLLKSIIPFIEQSMEQASTELFVITVKFITVEEDPSVVAFKYVMNRQEK